MPRASDAATPQKTVVAELTPIFAVVLIAFLAIGLGLPVLPLHVHHTLGFGPAIVGLVTGSQFAASLFSRVWSGRTCDVRGAKTAVSIGLAAAAAAGLIYLASLQFAANSTTSVIVLLVGRAVLGGAESFVITGATVWGLARVGATNAGQVIAWMGTAMFAAFAASAPIGVAIYDRTGFTGVAAVTMLASLATLLLVAPLRDQQKPDRREPHGMAAVLKTIWLPGLGAALASVGFGVILSFASLLFAERGWMPVWLAFTAFAVALILARLLVGHLPDKLGGARVALVCVVLEAAGLALLGLASSIVPAAIGAALTGLGYALVFPGLGVEAVRRTPPESRGITMGAYTACLDLALGMTGPVLGIVAGGVGLGSTFLVGAACVLSASLVALQLLRQPTLR